MSGYETVRLPEKGEAWPALRERLVGLGSYDVDWRNKKSAVYVFHPGEDVLEVAKEAYALYQSENALGPAAFPSLQRMETEVIAIAMDLLHGPVEGTGNLTRGLLDAVPIICIAIAFLRNCIKFGGIQVVSKI